jgi:class 3 adenylate cyclase
VEQPETRYAKSGGFHVAYQVVGEGPIDLAYLRNWTSHIEIAWEVGNTRALLQRLASFSRLILHDPRGTGLSDPVLSDEVCTLEDRVDDVRAVLDAVGSSNTAILASALVGPVGVTFSATHPHRTSALILYETAARFVRSDDYPHGVPPELIEQAQQQIMETWGSREMWAVFGQRPPDDEQLRSQFEKYNRMSMSPRTAAENWRMAIETDVRDVLTTVRVPTLILHRADSNSAAWSRYLADHIGGSRLLELNDQGSSAVSPTARALDEIQAFLTGVRPVRDAERVLATVLFTDIVSSTERAVAEGDRSWSTLLGRHNEIVARCIADFGGRQIDNAGDGVLATFDGPARAVRCACEIRDAVKVLGLEVRSGLHTGEIELADDDIRGIAVHTAARVSALAAAGEILVSSTVVDLVTGSDLRFGDRGEHDLKGVPRPWRIYALAE